MSLQPKDVGVLDCLRAFKGTSREEGYVHSLHSLVLFLQYTSDTAVEGLWRLLGPNDLKRTPQPSASVSKVVKW